MIKKTGRRRGSKLRKVTACFLDRGEIKLLLECGHVKPVMHQSIVLTTKEYRCCIECGNAIDN